MNLGERQRNVITRIIQHGGRIGKDNAYRIIYNAYHIRGNDFYANRKNARNLLKVLLKKGALRINNGVLFVTDKAREKIEELKRKDETEREKNMDLERYLRS